MSIIDTLVTDRTAGDVERANYLNGLAYLEDVTGRRIMTDAERAEWKTDLKGAYNDSDLNRVGAACAYIYERSTADYGVAVAGYAALRTDWAEEEIPTPSDMAVYISTIAALKSAWSAAREAPPGTMDDLDPEGANAIERLLIEIDRMMARITTAYIYAGEGFAGEF